MAILMTIVAPLFLHKNFTFLSEFFLVKMCVNHAVVSWCYISSTYGASLSEHALIYLAQNFCGQRGQTEIDIYLIRNKFFSVTISEKFVKLTCSPEFHEIFWFMYKNKSNPYHGKCPNSNIFHLESLLLFVYYYMFFTSANRMMLFP